jgi:hypothetical protein
LGHEEPFPARSWVVEKGRSEEPPVVIRQPQAMPLPRPGASRARRRLELWKDQAALDAHAELQAQRPPLPEGLRLGAGEREDYTFNRTR